MPAPPPLDTPRLHLRPLVGDDVPFLLALLNDPDFIRFVGDRKVRDLAGARRYLERGPWASYEANGFGPWAVLRREGGPTLGICGIWRRESLDAPDLGYGFLPAGRGQGFAREAAVAVLAWARGALGLRRILAITTPDHQRSRRLLESLGMVQEGLVRLPGDDVDLCLYATEPTRAASAPK